MLRLLKAAAHHKGGPDWSRILVTEFFFRPAAQPLDLTVEQGVQDHRRTSSSRSWDPTPTSNPWGAGKVVRAAKQPPKGKRKGGAKQPVPGSVAAVKKWAYERRKMASEKTGITIAIEGCCHGDLDKIYATLKAMEVKERRTIDLLICCGDFEAVRNNDDLECMACPAKYKELKSFWQYYTGVAVAPFPTLFVGGNHEAPNHLWELHNGGWVAPNIYYMGAAGVVNFAGVRIAGISGIFNGRHFRQGHYEKPPYTDSTMRSAYHIRELDVYRLAQLQQPLDVFLSHDWPRGISRHGDQSGLLRVKPFLRKEAEANTLGSPPGEMLLRELKPRYWFAAHLHVKFAAIVKHTQQPNRQQSSSDSRSDVATWRQQSKVDAQSAAKLAPGQQPQLGGMKAAEKQPPTAAEGDAGVEAGKRHATETRFLALDKCLPRRGFLQVLDFPEAKGPKELCYDEEWLSILRSTHHLFCMTPKAKPLPGMGGARRGASAADMAFVREALATRGGPTIPLNFVKTARGHDPHDRNIQQGRMPQDSQRNPQSEALFQLIGVPYNLESESESLPPPPPIPAHNQTAGTNPEEINLDNVIPDDPYEIDLDGEPSDVEDAPHIEDGAATTPSIAQHSANPEEILLDG